MIHQYRNNGYNIVLDVNSGSVHVVDDLCYDLIACLEAMNPDHTEATLQSEETSAYVKEQLGEKYKEDELKEALEDIAELTKEGQLFTKDIYEAYIGEVKSRKTVKGIVHPHCA